MHLFMQTAPRPDARTKLLDAAIQAVRARGFAATSVDELCRMAGVTKGAFFHHFESKEALGVAAANHWSETTGALFAQAPYHAPTDPLDRVLAYIDFRKKLLQGTPAEFTCFAGTTVQEAFASSDDIRAACKASIFGHAETLVADISEAMHRYKVKDNWTAQSLALHTQAVLQGAFILAKAANDAAVAVDSANHLRRYIELLFNRTRKKERSK
jgi:TetR/AcrR family transcriptional repressor of nem operon